MFKQEQDSSTGSGPPHIVAAAAPDALTAHKHNLTYVRSVSSLLSRFPQAWGSTSDHPKERAANGAPTDASLRRSGHRIIADA